MILLLRYVLIIIFIAFSCLAIDPLLSDSPINIEADKVEYAEEDKGKIIIASGDVIAIQDNQEVKAQYVEYNASKDILLAEDQVKIVQREGYIIDANKVVLSDRLRFGSVNDFTVIMPDKSTLKGKLARKDQEYIADIEQGFYTACQMCPGKSPIWEITAESATLDQQENIMTYHHPIFKMYGVPVLYSPYLSHYTSKAQRKSGFLRPSFGSSTYAGQMVKIPYYFNLAPNYDATIRPVFTSQRGVILEGEQRSLFANGLLNTNGSVTSGNENQPKGHTSVNSGTRYHVFSKADYKLPFNNYFGWKTKFTSDKSYLKDYGYGNEDFLTSRIYNSAYQEKGYYEIQAMSFQNLRSDSSSNNNTINQTPQVLPLFESDHNIHTFEDNSTLSFSTNILNIHRYVGADTNRYSAKTKWQKSLITDNGNKFTFFSSLRGDLYYYQQAPVMVNDQAENYTGSVTRTIPEAGVDWAYPLGRNFKNTQVTIEPLANLVLTPYTKYNNKIYNEDSPSSELNDANLFNESRYSGIDLIENTPKIAYGFRMAAYHNTNLNTSLLLGQAFREKPYDYVNDVKEDKFTDYVGRWKFNVMDKIITSYQFSFDKYNYVNKTNEANIKLAHNKAYISSNLLYYKNGQVVSGVKNRRELTLETGIEEYKNLSFAVNATKNLTSKADNPGIQNGFVSMGSRVKYVNDCITYSATINKDLTKNQDRKKNTEFWFDVSLKNIN